MCFEHLWMCLYQQTHFFHNYLQPSIASVWKQHQADLLQQPSILGGDGQLIALAIQQNLDLTVMDLMKGVVIDVQVSVICITFSKPPTQLL